MLNQGKDLIKYCRTKALDLFIPPSCVACNTGMEFTPEWGNLCASCLEKVPPVTWNVCKKCAARVPEIPGKAEYCVRCKDPDLKFDQTIALGDYDGLLRELILRMKRDSSELIAKTLASFICFRSEQILREMDIDCIVPVPMPWVRKLSRGTNPPAAVASQLGQMIDLKYSSRLLSKGLNSQPQLGLSSAGRFRNIRGQMQVRVGYPLDALHVLLVDDVMTTGATCNEAARLLKQSGASKVSVLVIARTPNT